MQLDKKIILAGLHEFLKRQYFVLFLMAAIGIKLALFPWLIGLQVRDAGMWVGYFFSLLTAAIIFAPLIFVKKGKKPLAILVSLVVSLVLFFDLVYFRFFQSLPTFGMMDTLSQARDIAPSALTLMKWSDLFLFLDIVLIISFEVVAFGFLKLPWAAKHKEQSVGKAERFFLGGLIAVLVVLLGLFSLASKPKQKLSDALSWSFETRYNTEYFGVIGSHLIDGYRFLEENLTPISATDKKAVSEWVNTYLKKDTSNDSLTGIAAGKRVIVVQVESLGNFVIGKKIYGQEITPNLNKLKKSAYYFADNRFVIGSGHTSDTDLVSNSSLYPLYDSAAFVRYGKDNYTGMAKVLAEAGYTSDAYHSYNRNFWNRSVALKALGFGRFYAAENYPKGPTINMNGLADAEFLQKTAEYLKENPEKSLSYVVTLSSHYPFAITSQTQGLKLDANALPPFDGGYLEDINYTDQAIGNFFTNLKKEGLYDDSVIVVYGDHTPTMTDFTVGNLSYKEDSLVNKQVPLFIKIPGQTTGVLHTKTTTHLDIVPSILDLLGVKSKGPMFGQSLFLDDSSSLPRCKGGEVIHVGDVNGCEAEITTEKSISAKIVKYNLFSDLVK